MAPPGEPQGSWPGDETSSTEAVAVTQPVGGKLLLRLLDGGESELEIPAELCHLVGPGTKIVLHHGRGGELLGWYVPERDVGVDLRQ